MDFSLQDLVHILTFFIATFFVIFVNKLIFVVFPVKTDRRKLLNALTMLLFFVGIYYLGALNLFPWVEGDESQKAMMLLIVYFSTMVFVTSLDYFIWNGICVRGHRTGVPKILTNSLKVIIYFIVLVACGNVIYGLELSALLAAAGLFTFLLGMAAQPTVANLFAGLAIQFGGKLKKGAYIEASGKEGVISAFTWRSTTVTGAQRFVIPNSSVANQTITIFNVHEQPFKDGKIIDIDGNCVLMAVGSTVTSRAELYALRGRFISAFINRCRKKGVALIAPDILMSEESGVTKHFESPSADAAITTSPVPPTQEEIIATIRKNEIFSHLDEAALEGVSKVATVEHFANGEVLCVQNEPGSSFFGIIRGTACTSELHEKVRVKMRDLVESDVVGLKAFLLAEPRRITVEATSSSLWVVSIDRADFQPILDSHPEVLEGLSNLLIKRETENMKKHGELDKDAEADQDIGALLLSKIGNLFKRKK